MSAPQTLKDCQCLLLDFEVATSRQAISGRAGAVSSWKAEVEAAADAGTLRRKLLEYIDATGISIDSDICFFDEAQRATDAQNR